MWQVRFPWSRLWDGDWGAVYLRGSEGSGICRGISWAVMRPLQMLQPVPRWCSGASLTLQHHLQLEQKGQAFILLCTEEKCYFLGSSRELSLGLGLGICLQFRQSLMWGLSYELATPNNQYFQQLQDWVLPSSRVVNSMMLGAAPICSPWSQSPLPCLVAPVLS